MILSRRLIVRLHHTDAAGLIFFPRLFDLVQEVLEEAMQERGADIARRLEGDGPIMPIVHCEADFRRPLRLGDEVTVQMHGERLGQSSLAFRYRFLDASGEEAAVARTVHAAMDRRTGAKALLTEEMRALGDDR